MEILAQFPKQVTLHDGTVVTLRPLVKEDEDKLFEFFAGVPLEDRLYLKEDVGRKEVIEAWIRDLDYEKVLPLVAEVDGRIVADATLHRRKMGWTSHIGKVRVVIAKAYRHKGLGTRLVEEIIELAKAAGLEQLVAEVMEAQPTALKAFRKLGFEKKAVLENYVKDLDGKLHNLVLLIYDLTATHEPVLF